MNPAEIEKIKADDVEQQKPEQEGELICIDMLKHDTFKYILHVIAGILISFIADMVMIHFTLITWVDTYDKGMIQVMDILLVLTYAKYPFMFLLLIPTERNFIASGLTALITYIGQIFVLAFYLAVTFVVWVFLPTASFFSAVVQQIGLFEDLYKHYKNVIKT